MLLVAHNYSRTPQSRRSKSGKRKLHTVFEQFAKDFFDSLDRSTVYRHKLSVVYLKRSSLEYPDAVWKPDGDQLSEIRTSLDFDQSLFCNEVKFFLQGITSLL